MKLVRDCEATCYCSAINDYFILFPPPPPPSLPRLLFILGAGSQGRGWRWKYITTEWGTKRGLYIFRSRELYDKYVFQEHASRRDKLDRERWKYCPRRVSLYLFTRAIYRQPIGEFASIISVANRFEYASFLKSQYARVNLTDGSALTDHSIFFNTKIDH